MHINRVVLVALLAATSNKVNVVHTTKTLTLKHPNYKLLANVLEHARDIEAGERFQRRRHD
jgi:hypothetical protein